MPPVNQTPKSAPPTAPPPSYKSWGAQAAANGPDPVITGHQIVGAVKSLGRRNDPPTTPPVSLTDHPTGRTMDPGWNAGPQQTKQTQALLKNLGYNVTIDGKAGPISKSAWSAYIKGMSPGAWNHFIANWSSHQNPSGGTTTPPPDSRQTTSATPPPGNTDTSGGTTAGSGLTAAQIMAMIGGNSSSATNKAMLALLSQGSNVGTMLPLGMASAQAAGEFDPTINQLKLAIGEQPRQAAQDQMDIKSWNNQLTQMMQAAGQQSTAAYNGASSDVGNAAAGIIASLGGSANAGTTSVGDMGTADAGSLAAQGNADAWEHAQLAPLFKLAEVGALNSDRATQSQNALQLQNNLASTLGQKNSAIATNMANIIGQNNSLAQQRFSNKFGTAQQIASNNLTSSGNSLANYTKLLQAQRTTQEIALGQQAYKKGQLSIDKLNLDMTKEHQAIKAAQGKPPAGSFGTVKPNDKTKIWTQAGSSLFYQSTDPAVLNHQAAAGDPKFQNLDQAVKMINDSLRARGFSSSDPGARQYRDTMLAQMLKPWLNASGINSIPKAWETNW